MTHPEELLAGYVDAALSPAERVVVDKHLASCGLCRGEVALAAKARMKLSALTEEPAPAEISVAVGRALAQTMSGGTAGGRVPARYRVMTVLSAAAVVALLVVTLPHLGRSNKATSQLAAGNGSEATNKEVVPAQVPTGTLRIEIQTTDYTASTAAKLLQRTPTPSAAASDGSFGGIQSGTDAAARTALSCLSTAFAGIPGTPVRLISASFQGQPAYLGVYTEGPGAGLPADTVTVRVASATSCTVLTFASSKI